MNRLLLESGSLLLLESGSALLCEDSTGSGAVGNLLLESGDRLLLESGDGLLIEDSGAAPATNFGELLLESGDRLLLESGDGVLLEWSDYLLTTPIYSAAKAGVTFGFDPNSTGTTYYVVGPAIGWRNPTPAEVAAGQLYGGATATFAANQAAPADAGAWLATASITGTSGGVEYRVALVYDAGSAAYSNVAVSAAFWTGYVLSAEAGSYALTGGDATLTYTGGSATYTLTAESGSYSLTGQDASLTFGRVLNAESGTYALSGQDATFLRGYVVSAGSGSFALTGGSVSFAWSGAPTAVKTIPTWYYSPGNIPLDAPQWLQRELLSVSRATYGAAPIMQFQPQFNEPAKPRDGMTCYFDATGWDPGSGTGVYTRVSGAWVKLG